jgi:uncharacterized protein YndB with AHSA1/START domain
MKVTLRSQVHIDSSPEDVFDVAADYRSFSRFIHKLAVIPGAITGEMLDGAQPGVGARRRLAMSDGTTVDEEVLTFERGKEHRYRWVNPPAPPFSLLVNAGEARWTFDRSGHGTKVVWTYELTLTSPLAYPLALPVQFLFKRWMDQGLLRLAGLFAR